VIADLGLRIADCGLRIWDWGARLFGAVDPMEPGLPGPGFGRRMEGRGV